MFLFFFFFFFKQKTAYEITEGDWSPDVCSSDLSVAVAIAIGCATPGPDTFKAANVQNTSLETISAFVKGKLEFDSEIGADSALVDFRQGLIGGKDARRARIEPERWSFRLTAQDRK